jgi:hypothetical protein
MKNFSEKEIKFLKKLNTPGKVQDYLNTLKFNFEKKGETLKSPLRTLREKNAHCFEGAMLGAYILSLHGFPPLVLHLKTTKDDYDHVVAPFEIDGLWGALSKTNHAVLRYREPIYKNIRELTISYFHEYFLDNGKKTLREYSVPLNLNSCKKDWAYSEKDLWYIDKKLDKIKHFKILNSKQMGSLRKADGVEIQAGKIKEWGI